MDKNQGYSFFAAMLENGRGFALGEHPTGPVPYVTWACYDDEHGQRQYEWGHYGNDLTAMEQDLQHRLMDYQRRYKVQLSRWRPLGFTSITPPSGLWTSAHSPKPPTCNAPDEIVNYDQRVPVEGGAFLAWGHLTYTRPLTDQAGGRLRAAARPGVWRSCAVASGRTPPPDLPSR